MNMALLGRNDTTIRESAEEYYESCIAAGLRPATTSVKKCTIGQFIRWAEPQGIVLMSEVTTRVSKRFLVGGCRVTAARRNFWRTWTCECLFGYIPVRRCVKSRKKRRVAAKAPTSRGHRQACARPSSFRPPSMTPGTVCGCRNPGRADRRILLGSCPR